MSVTASVFNAFERLGGENLGKEIKGSLKRINGPLTSNENAQRLIHRNEQG